MEVVDRMLPVHREQLLRLVGDRRLRLSECRVVGRHRLGPELRSQVVGDGRRQHEVAVGQALHERAGSQAVRALIGEVGLTEHVEPGHVAHQVVVDPESTHRVVDRRVDAHRHLVRVLVGDALVHLEEVPVALLDDVAPEALDRLREVEVHAVLLRTDAAPGVDFVLDRTRRDVTRDQVAERRVATLEEVVAVGGGDLVGGAGVVELRRDPDPAVVAQRLRHQRELALEVVAARDAGGMDLGEARVGEQRPAPVGAPGRGDVAGLRVRRQVVGVAVPAGAERDRVRRPRLDRAGGEVAGHDARGAAVLHDEVEHLAPGVQLHRAAVDLVRERLVGAEQQLLAGLATRVEGARHLRAAERAVVEQAAVLAGERHALGDALVDDVDAHLGESVHVAFTGAEVAALHGVVEEAVDAVAVVGVVLRRVDATLGRDAVGAPRGVVEREQLHPVAELAEGRRRGCPREPTPDDDDLEASLVRRVHQLHVELVLRPLLGDRPRGDPGVEFSDHAGPLLVLRTGPLRPRFVACRDTQHAATPLTCSPPRS